MPEQNPRPPRWLVLAWTALVAVIVPVYWVSAGPQNFLWFCDIALFLTLYGLWFNSPLPISMAAVSVLAIELVWAADLAVSLLSLGGYRGLTAYVFDPDIALGVRILSVVFHLALLAVLPYLLHRMGYAPRALRWQCGLTWLVLPLSRLASTPEQNLNWTWGLGRTAQDWIPAWAWVLLLMAFVPVGILLPTHWALRRLFRSER